MPEMICTPKSLPDDLLLPSAATAARINPANAPAPALSLAAVLPPEHLALLTSRYWGGGGVSLAVGFLEPVAADLSARILSHMNAWGQYCNCKFSLTQQIGSAQVRITLAGDGYWSYLGTDILHIPAGQPTMSLQGFTMGTAEGEYRRVVRHETGHTLGFIHEHLRKELVARLDPAKTIAWGASQLGWSAAMVQQQILTPADDSSLTETPAADQLSIMCYQLPGSITVDGQPILGGTDIDPTDQQFAAKLYRLPNVPPPPVGPVPAGALFPMTFNKSVPLGATFVARAKKPIPAGTYGLVPQAAGAEEAALAVGIFDPDD